MTDSKIQFPDPRDIITAIMHHEGVDEQEATHRLLERTSGELRPTDREAGKPEKTTAERIQSLRIAAELVHADADAHLVPYEGQDPAEAGTKADVDYRGPYAMAELLTAIADHSDQLPAPVIAWGITLAEAVIEGDEEDGCCRFCKCTDGRACRGGCSWATDEQIREVGLEPMDGDVCSVCCEKKAAGILVVA